MWHSGLADRCDRCGELYLRDIVIRLPLSYRVRMDYYDAVAQHPHSHGEYFDLCPKCQNELAEWIEKGVNNGKA